MKYTLMLNQGGYVAAKQTTSWSEQALDLGTAPAFIPVVGDLFYTRDNILTRIESRSVSYTSDMSQCIIMLTGGKP